MSQACEPWLNDTRVWQICCFFFVPCLCRIFSRFRFGPRTPPCFVNFHQATLLCKYAMAFRLIMGHVFSLFFFFRLVPGQGLLGRGYGQEFWGFGPLNETLTLFKAQRWKICCPVTIKDWTKHYHNTFKTITTQNQWKSRGLYESTTMYTELCKNPIDTSALWGSSKQSVLLWSTDPSTSFPGSFISREPGNEVADPSVYEGLAHIYNVELRLGEWWKRCCAGRTTPPGPDLD